MHLYNSYKRNDSMIKQDTHTQKKMHIVKIWIRISMMVMKGVESSSRAKRKVCRAK